MDGDFDLGTVAGEGFVDRVVYDFEYAVMEAALVGVADVHVGALADAFEAFELLNIGSVVFCVAVVVGGRALRFVCGIHMWRNLVRKGRWFSDGAGRLSEV